MVDALIRGAPRPDHVCGASAGALVAACYGAGLRPEALGEELSVLERGDFWDPAPGPGLLRGRLFRERLHGLLPRTFAECRTPVSVAVHDVLGRRPRALTSGSLPAAVHASCAVPFMFRPVRVGGRLYVDGGVSDRPGVTAMPEGRVLFHHLASRSPWRRPGSESLNIPRRRGLVSLVIEGLPRVHPFRLDRGRDALAIARRATERALDLPICDGRVAVPVP
ncbi:MAG: patatin-like phospholipase family protein [Deltaproteobacteria bacterium]|nr:patatin-like phospholipase family protein [Deltaproteobacteria bacterium]